MSAATQYTVNVTGSATITARSERDLEERLQALRTSLEWTLNNVEIEVEDEQESPGRDER